MERGAVLRISHSSLGSAQPVAASSPFLLNFSTDRVPLAIEPPAQPPTQLSEEALVGDKCLACGEHEESPGTQYVRLNEVLPEDAVDPRSQPAPPLADATTAGHRSDCRSQSSSRATSRRRATSSKTPGPGAKARRHCRESEIGRSQGRERKEPACSATDGLLG